MLKILLYFKEHLPCEILPEPAVSCARNASRISSRAWNGPGHFAKTSKKAGNESSSAPCDKL